jgi:cytochrome c553
VDYRYEKRWDPVMEHMADHFLLPNAQAVADVAGFVASLGIASQAGVGQATHLSAGRQAYLGRCSSCHGPSGQGNEKELVPRLAGQHYAYLLRQLYDAIDGRRQQLSGSHGGMLKDLDRDALQGMADLLSRF